MRMVSVSVDSGGVVTVVALRFIGSPLCCPGATVDRKRVTRRVTAEPALPLGPAGSLVASDQTGHLLIDLPEPVREAPAQGAAAEREEWDMNQRSPTFAADIRPLFRDSDIEEMSWSFDLASYDEVRENGSRS